MVTQTLTLARLRDRTEDDSETGGFVSSTGPSAFALFDEAQQRYRRA